MYFCEMYSNMFVSVYDRDFEVKYQWNIASKVSDIQPYLRSASSPLIPLEEIVVRRVVIIILRVSCWASKVTASDWPVCTAARHVWLLVRIIVAVVHWGSAIVVLRDLDPDVALLVRDDGARIVLRSTGWSAHSLLLCKKLLDFSITLA